MKKHIKDTLTLNTAVLSIKYNMEACKYDSASFFDLEAAVMQAENAMEAQRWIPISERQPKLEEYKSVIEDSQYFLRLEIAVQTDTIEYYIGYFDGYKWFDKRHRSFGGDVVAWKIHQSYQP